MSSNPVKALQVAAELLAVAAVAACTNNGVDETALVNTQAAAQYSIGGSVSGLTGSGLLLQSNTGEKLKIAQDGAFHFATTLTSASSYYVIVSVQPQAPSQTCSVTSGTGTISAGNIDSVQVSCQNKTSQMDSIGGTAVGATGSGLVLQNNGSDNLAISSNGAFTFATPLSTNSPYSVSVLSPPINPYQNCSISNSPGVTAESDVSNIVVSCTINSNPTHTIGGTVTGLAQGTTLILQDNGRDNLTVTSDGSFAFPMPIPSGSPYNVSVLSASSGIQSQTCLVQNASAVVGTGNVTGVAVQCTSNLVLSVSVSGLSGAGLVLENTHNGDSLPVASNGTATFTAALAPGDAYNVTVASPPTNPSQTCAVTNGAGTAGVVPGPTVTCATNGYLVGGIVTGLPDPNQGATLNLVLVNNGDNNPADVVSIAPTSTSPYAFNFPTQVLSGSPYSVTVASQPGVNLNTTNTPGVVQTSTVCVVSAGTGTVTNAAVSSVVVNCVQPVGFAYVTNNGDNTVSAYLIGQNGALLSSGAAIATDQGPSGAAAYIGGFGSAPSNSFLYVTNQGSNNLSVYNIDPNTGALTSATADTTALSITAPTSIIQGPDMATALFVAGTGPEANQTQVSALSIGAFGKTLTNLPNSPAINQTVGPQVPLVFSATAPGVEFYLTAVPGNVLAYPVDSAKGGFTLQSPNSANVSAAVPAPTSIAVQSLINSNTGALNGAMVYVADSSKNTITEFSQDTEGAVSPPPPIFVSPPISGLRSLTVFGGGTTACCYLYATGSQGIYAYPSPPYNGFAAVTPVAAGGGPGPIATTRPQFNTGLFPDNVNFLYVVNVIDGTVSAYSVDPSTGLLTPVAGSPPKTGAAPSSIIVRPRPSYIYIG